MHVALRDVQERDLALLFEHQADPVAAQMAAFPSRDREAFTAHWGRLLAARGTEEGPITKAILADGRVAGNIGCWEQEGERLVGYWIGREYWGQGSRPAPSNCSWRRSRPVRCPRG